MSLASALASNLTLSNKLLAVVTHFTPHLYFHLLRPATIPPNKIICTNVNCSYTGTWGGKTILSSLRLPLACSWAHPSFGNYQGIKDISSLNIRPYSDSRFIS
jgi:hypothetical protein